MGRNLFGGKKKKKGRNKNSDQTTRELIYKEENQDYARVIKLLGDNRVLATNGMHDKILCIIRGKLRKRAYIHIDDLILISYRDFQSTKADVIHRYTPQEATTLKKYGELNEIKERKSVEDEEEEECFNFDDI